MPQYYNEINGVVFSKPVHWTQIQPQSIDLTLDDWIMVPKKTGGIPNVGDNYEDFFEVPKELSDYPFGFVISRGDFCLLRTAESIKVPHNVVGRLDGRSGMARLGLMIHATAHTINPGFNGRLVLECSVIGPFSIKLSPGDSVCQVSFSEIEHSYTRYNGKFQNQFLGE